MFKEKEKKPEPTLEDKKKLTHQGMEFLRNNQVSAARACLREAGVSEKELKPLFELEEFLKKQKKKPEENKQFSEDIKALYKSLSEGDSRTNFPKETAKKILEMLEKKEEEK